MDTPNEHASAKVYFTLMFLVVAGLTGWISYLNYAGHQVVMAAGLGQTVATIVVCESPDRNYLATIKYTYRVNDSVYLGFDRVSCPWCDCEGQKNCLGKKYLVDYANADPTQSWIKLEAPQPSE